MTKGTHTPELDTRTYGCGCKATVWRMEWCLTHAAAPEMLRLLKAACLPGDPGVAGWVAWELSVRALLARIEGQQ